MSRLIETIRLENGKFDRLEYHQQRVDHSLKSIFPASGILNLEKILNNVAFPKEGLFKCRIVYDNQNHTIEFTPYIIRSVSSLRMAERNSISYPFKFENRAELVEAFTCRQNSDDVLIIKNGKVTDTSYSNIVFKKGSKWTTPTSCLLKGTMRQFLLDKGAIQEEEITVTDIDQFEKFKLINSMIGWDGEEINVSNIV
ncbi:MAG TPA: aminotransferase class IV [Cyclobacteriaceae bacterium]